MKFIEILCLFLVAAVNALAVDWSCPESFEDGLRISAKEQLQYPGSARIIHGKEAVPKQFPYMADLVLYKSRSTAFCGGSIISNRWVVRAAHCTYNLSDGLDVLLGVWNSKYPEPDQHIIFVSVKDVIQHEEWNRQERLNDISLIKLPVVITFNEYIQPVNLPKISETYSTYAGGMAIVSGWGVHVAGENQLSGILRWTKIPILENEKCAQRFVPGRIKSTNICLDTTGGTLPCYGDSGGPMVLADGSRTLLGIASFTKQGCTVGEPSVFTRIASYLDWIAERTGVVNN